jgi:hypothetical protein
MLKKVKKKIAARGWAVSVRHKIFGSLGRKQIEAFVPPRSPKKPKKSRSSK